MFKNISIKQDYKKAFEWSKLLAVTGSVQLMVQVIGFISGLLVIRLFSTQEYALYILANTMLSTITILADGGITTVVLSQGGKVWQDKVKLGSVLSTGFYLKKKIAIGSLLITTPVLLFLLRSNGASWLMAVLIVVSILPACYMALSGSLLQVPLRLRQDISPLQKIEVGSNIGRLTMLLLTLFIFPWAFVAVLASGLPQIWANFRLRKLSNNYADWTQKPDPEVQIELIAFVKRILPGAIYFCVSGQVSLWLISFFGSSTGVAHIGALGRLTIVLSILNAIVHTLVIPRFARLPNDKNLLLLRYFQIKLGLLFLSLCIISFVYVFSSEVLWILGNQYSALKNEVVLSFVGSCLHLIAGVSFHLFTSRGWTINPFIAILISVSSILCGILLFDVTTIKGVIMMNVFSAFVELILYIIMHIIKMSNIKKPENAYTI